MTLRASDKRGGWLFDGHGDPRTGFALAMQLSSFTQDAEHVRHFPGASTKDRWPRKMSATMLVVDAHLDLAYNVTRGRDPRMPAREQPVADDEIATVGLPDLRAGNVGLICATIFAEPVSERRPRGYRDAAGAHAQAMSQLAWYERQVSDRLMRVVRRADELPRGTGFQPVSDAHGLKTRATDAQPFILLMEGADPIRTHDDVQRFHDAGVRIVGMAWKRT